MSNAATPRSMRLIWRLARLVVGAFYRATRVGPALPDGPVLLVANHPNALIDPAVIASMAGRPIRFVAKSTLFRGHPLGPLIRRSGAIPVYRRMDAGADMSRNVEMFTAVEAALSAGDAVCLFPEGVSHSTGRLAELRTGAARIALGSAMTGTRVAIVPVGLNFERATRFRSRVTAVFGGPFWCDDLVAQHQPGDAGAVRALTERMGEHLRRLMIEADPRRELQLVHRVDRLYSAARGVSRSVEDQLRRRRASLPEASAGSASATRTAMKRFSNASTRTTRSSPGSGCGIATSIGASRLARRSSLRFAS